MRRFLWLFIPTIFFATSLGVLWHLTEKKLAAFVISKAKETLKRQTEWELEIDALDLQLAPPGFSVKNVNLRPPASVHWVAPLHLASLTAKLDFLNLLAGQIKFSLIHASGLNANIALHQIPESKEPLETLPINDIFNALQVIPVKMILVEKTKLSLQIKPQSQSIDIEPELLLQATPQTIHYGLKILTESEPPAYQQMPKQKIHLVTKGSLSTKTLQVNSLSLGSNKSKIELQGEFINFAKVIRQPAFSGYLDLDLHAEDIQYWSKLLSLFPLPKLNGHLHSKGQLEIQKWTEPTLTLENELSNIVIEDFVLGDLKTELKLGRGKLSTAELELKHPSGQVFLKNVDWNLHKDEITAAVDLRSLDLQKLFLEIHLARIPVDLLIAGQLNCHGKLLRDFGLACDGKVEGKKLNVRAEFEKSASPIVELESFSGTGKVSVDLKEVTYNSTIDLPFSHGQTHGTINYQTGFIIDFDSNNFDFKDMTKLAGLNFEGKARLQGRTQGNSQTATLEISLGTQDFWFENFGLGSIDGKVSYQKGHLLIDAPQARLLNSSYTAQLDVDLVQSKLHGLVESANIHGQDALQALSRRVPIPFAASGSGRVRAQFEGPFQLGALTYRFEGVLQKGEIQGETYDEIKWDWSAKNGNVTIENNTLQKGTALIVVNGKAVPSGHLALEIDGNNFKLENSTFLSKYIKTLGGDINFHMSITNHILKPDVFLEGTINHTTLGDSELPDSKFIFETDAIGQSLTLDLIGHQLRLDLDLPYSPTDQARLFVEVQKFDFTDFLASLLGSPLRSDYSSLLSLRMDIQSENNDIFKSSGILRVDDLYLARSEHFLRNSKPMFVHFENGLASLKDFSIQGRNTEIIATGENFSPSKLKINIGGSLDLRLLQLFTPFLDDISGPVKGQIQVSGSLASPEIYGNVDINDVALKLKGFSPLFDHINSHLEFSQKRIIIESIRGSLAGGALTGDGAININGTKDIRVDVKAQLKNIQMEVPEHIQSSGSAEIVLSGNWFPYVLSGSYRVQQAFIDKDFTADSGDNTVRQSIYLPKNLAANGFDPIVLDLQVLLDKKIEIKNPQMSGFLTGQLQVKGPPQSPLLFGTIKTLPNAQLFFRDKIFEVQSGLVRFNDPAELNPELYFTARSIVDKYEVNLLLQGKAKAPQFSLTSQPPLAEPDIISLLALGMTTQKLDTQVQSSQQAAQTGYQLGTAIISANPLNKEIKQSLGVDLKFSSGFDDTKNVAVPRVTVSKDIIPRKLNASASSSFNEQNYDVRFQYLLNDRLSTVVTYEKNESQTTTATTNTNKDSTSIFGLDLEYKVEFK